MAKNKSIPEEEAKEITEAEPEGNIEEHAAAFLPAPFTLGEWNGLTQYKCKFCPFDTLHEDVALEHYAARHAPPPPPKPVSLIPVFDRWGNEVKPQPEEGK